MNDYEFNKQTLKPNKFYTASPKHFNNHNTKQKIPSTTSRSKQKQIVTSFSKKESQNSIKNWANTKSNQVQLKKLHQPDQYQRPATSQTRKQIIQYEDELQLKNNQIQLLNIKLNKLDVENRHLKHQLEVKENSLSKLELQMNNLLAKSLKQLDTERLGTDLVYQCQRYKYDQRRLLHMLKNTKQYETFAKFAIMDEGIEFLRIPNLTKKTIIDLPIQKTRSIHYCSCNKELTPQINLWVPQKAFDFGTTFIREHTGQITRSQLQLLLYELNRIWRQREKKIINSMSKQKIDEIEKQKRKVWQIKSLQKVK